MLEAVYAKGTVSAKLSDEARALHDQSRYGQITKTSYQLSLLEALYLLDKKKLTVKDARERTLDFEALEKLGKKEPYFLVRYAVYADLRTRGYIVKTAFKFGADFRVYDKGVKPGEDHAKWVVFPVHESQKHTWHEFSAKNRVAHSTKKRLLLGIVDDEYDVTYYEVKWVRP